MNNNKTIRIKNELPELLEAVCSHSDCPEWLSDGIWDLIHNQPQVALFSALAFRATFEAINESAVGVLSAEVLNEE